MTIVIALLLVLVLIVQILHLRLTRTLNDNLCKSAVGLSRQQEAIAEAVKAARSMRTSP